MTERASGPGLATAPILAGKYVLGEELGRGGMGVVHRARHRNGHRVAIKVMHSHLAGCATSRARFVTEARASNLIEHPGVARVFDDGTTDDGRPFLVLELLDGMTTARRAALLGGRIAVRETLGIAAQVLGVLAAAHAAGVIHRDVKPENLLLLRGGGLKLLDFGIASMGPGGEPRVTAPGGVPGTPAFLPPELAVGRSFEATAAVDIFGVGATMFALLTGRPPRAGGSAAEVLALASTRPVPRLADEEPDVPARVAAIVDRALRFEARDRWEGAGAMRDAVVTAFAAIYGGSPEAALPAEPDAREAGATPGASGAWHLSVGGGLRTLDPSTATPTASPPARHRHVPRNLGIGLPILLAAGLGAGAGSFITKARVQAHEPPPPTEGRVVPRASSETCIPTGSAAVPERAPPTVEVLPAPSSAAPSRPAPIAAPTRRAPRVHGDDADPPRPLIEDVYRP